MQSRLKKAILKLKKSNFDALLIKSQYNIRYLTGFHGEEALLLLSRNDKPQYFTDGRYLSDAKIKLKNIEVRDIAKHFFKSTPGLLKKHKIKKLGFETNYFTYLEYCKLCDFLNKRKLIAVNEFIEEFRQIKDKKELSLIKKANKISKQALKRLAGIRLQGKTEKQIRDFLECEMRQNGAESSAFEIIVAVDANASSAHAKSADRKITSKSLILVDLGAKFQGYNSDLTRVFFSGKIGSSDSRIGKVLRIVDEAKSLAINEIRPGCRISSIEKKARDLIEKHGFKDQFVHSLGHGVGLEVHENPRISIKNDQVIEEGMVFTIEPGIYLPGEFGIRLEDMVVVEKKGAKIL